VFSRDESIRYEVDTFHGGAIALGHPTGCSGARILVTLYYALTGLNKELGMASICGGGGSTMAMVLRRES
jgi:acetyl-CoA C-acetyltransferase